MRNQDKWFFFLVGILFGVILTITVCTVAFWLNPNRSEPVKQMTAIPF
jgi:hypothetical protein